MIMKNRIFIISLMVLLCTLLIVVDTYALFETDRNDTSDLSIGKWKIKVDGTDTSLLETITLNSFTYSSSPHTQSGYFAPGMSATFDVEIDASEADVSVEYDLTIDDEILEEYPNMHFSVSSSNSAGTTTGTHFTGVIGVNDNSRVVTLTITLVWDNQAQYDESDTTLNGGTIAFSIAANFKQYLGEEEEEEEEP